MIISANKLTRTELHPASFCSARVRLWDCPRRRALTLILILILKIQTEKTDLNQ